MDIKYINTTVDGMPGLVLFPGYMNHREVAAGREVSGAGFVNLAERRCYGESVSLGIKSQPFDTTALRMLIPKEELRVV